MHMMMLVLNDPEKLDDLLDAWHELGMRGATVLDSTGIYRRRPHLMGARYAFGFPPVGNMDERGHYTIFAVVADAEMVSRYHEAAVDVLGDLDEPNTGVMASWRLDQAWGARRQFGPSFGDENSEGDEDGEGA